MRKRLDLRPFGVASCTLCHREYARWTDSEGSAGLPDVAGPCRDRSIPCVHSGLRPSAGLERAGVPTWRALMAPAGRAWRRTVIVARNASIVDQIDDDVSEPRSRPPRPPLTERPRMVTEG